MTNHNKQINNAISTIFTDNMEQMRKISNYFISDETIIDKLIQSSGIEFDQDGYAEAKKIYIEFFKNIEENINEINFNKLTKNIISGENNEGLDTFMEFLETKKNN